VPAILATLAVRAAPPSWVAERIRFARSASAPLPTPVARAFTARTGISVLQTYGMTEAAGQITANPLDPSARREGSVGVGLAVLGPEGQLLPAGETSMVALQGPAVTAHYLVTGPDGHERVRPAADAFGRAGSTAARIRTRSRSSNPVSRRRTVDSGAPTRWATAAAGARPSCSSTEVI
jgi:acyl-CoA synthetase (AMP-forming)/AMP-acid ligase II